VNFLALRVNQFAGADFTTPGGITRAVGCHQSVKAQLPAQRFIEYFDLGVHEQDWPMRIREDVFYEPVAAVGLRIRQTIKEAIALRVFDQVIQVALFLMAKRFAITDEKLKVARVRLIDTWIIDLVNDAVLSVNHRRQLVW